MRKKKKKVKYETDITLFSILRLRHELPCNVVIDGSDSEWLIITVSTGNTLYTIKMKEEKL